MTTTADNEETKETKDVQGSTVEDGDDSDDATIRGIAEWAYPAYEHAWYEYVADGAAYGRDYDGLMQWIGERVAMQRAAYEASQRGPSFATWLLSQLATLMKHDRSQQGQQSHPQQQRIAPKAVPDVRQP